MEILTLSVTILAFIMFLMCMIDRKNYTLMQKVHEQEKDMLRACIERTNIQHQEFLAAQSNYNDALIKLDNKGE